MEEFYLVFSISALLISSTRLVKLLEEFSSHNKLSKIFLSSIFLAFVTSLPEMVVSAIAIYENDFQLSSGNLLGSNVTNLLLIFGVGLLINGIGNSVKEIKRDSVNLTIFVLLNLIVLFFVDDLTIKFLTTMISGFLYFSATYQSGKYSYQSELKKAEILLNNKQIIKFLLWSILLIISGLVFVEVIEKLSFKYHISSGYLGMTLVALSTSLPELITTIVAQLRHQKSIAIGNLMGSSVVNVMILIILNYFSNNNKFEISPLLLFWLIGSQILFFIIINQKRINQIQSKIFGLILVFLYVSYLYTSK